MVVVGKIMRALTCPGCHKPLRWSGTESGRVRCPTCRTRFVALVAASGECLEVVEDEFAVGQMIADWLRPDWEDEDDFAPGEPAIQEPPRVVPAVIAPDAPPPADQAVRSPDSTGVRRAG